MATIFRADTVGSMVRPAYLNTARARLMAGQLSLAEFKKLEDRAVDEALEIQETAGLDVVADGEMRRTQFTVPGSGTTPPSGATKTPRTIHWRRTEGGVRQEQDSTSWVSPITDKVKFSGTSKAVEEYSYAAARAKKPVKIAIPGPTAPLGRWSAEHSAAVYPNPKLLLEDATQATIDELKALKAAGCRYVQIDAPDLTSLLPDEWLKSHSANRSAHLHELLSNEGLEAMNAVATVPGLTIGLHMCRSNHKGFWINETPWDQLSKLIIPRVKNYDLFLLEYDDWRSGSFEPLREIPTDKVAVLGLISTKHEALEPADQILQRLEEASRFFPREQLTLSTQCGFAPAADGAVVSMGGQEAKLRLVAEIAHRFWS